MTTGVSKRVPDSGTPAPTQRVATVGGSPAIVGSAWGATWARAWGNSWGILADAIAASPVAGATIRVAAAAATDATSRISALPVGGQTSRVSANLLAFEGDESGYLTLEGSVQSGGDLMKLEGDEAAIVGGSAAKRIAVAVQ